MYCHALKTDRFYSDYNLSEYTDSKEFTFASEEAAKQEIYDNLKRLAAQGVGIIIFSSETDELLSSSDRILIMREGRIVKELITARTSSEEILHYSIAAAD